MSARQVPWVLVCAGRDPSGGAGVDADAEAIEAAGGRSACVVTTETEQDGRRVFGVRPREERDWSAEARRLLDETLGAPPRALKFGLLARAAAVEAAVELAQAARSAGLAVVVDPVLAASGGERFLGPDGVARLLERLVPVGVVLTPNLLEAAELTGADAAQLADDPEARSSVARELLERGAQAVVLKGGHGGEDPVRDLVAERGRPLVWVEHPRVAGGGIHGSGCRHASFLAARLAAGDRLEAAAALAGRYLRERIAAG